MYYTILRADPPKKNDELDLDRLNQERDPTGAEPKCLDQSPAWRPTEIPLGDGRTLILEDS